MKSLARQAKQNLNHVLCNCQTFMRDIILCSLHFPFLHEVSTLTTTWTKPRQICSEEILQTSSSLNYLLLQVVLTAIHHTHTSTNISLVEDSPTWRLWTLNDPVWLGWTPLPLSHGKEAGEGKKTASLSCEWWVAAMGDILPSLLLSPPHYPTAFTVSLSLFSSPLPWYFSLLLYSPLSPSLNPSIHFSFTPLLLCLLFFHSLIHAPLSSTVLFLSAVTLFLLFSPLYAPPSIASFLHLLSPWDTHTHTHNSASAKSCISLWSWSCRHCAPRYIIDPKNQEEGGCIFLGLCRQHCFNSSSTVWHRKAKNVLQEFKNSFNSFK